MRFARLGGFYTYRRGLPGAGVVGKDGNAVVLERFAGAFGNSGVILVGVEGYGVAFGWRSEVRPAFIERVERARRTFA